MNDTERNNKLKAIGIGLKHARRELAGWHEISRNDDPDRLKLAAALANLRDASAELERIVK